MLDWASPVIGTKLTGKSVLSVKKSSSSRFRIFNFWILVPTGASKFPPIFSCSFKGSGRERDGQYFHYLTAWISTLLLANRETGEEKYTQWAVELLKAGKKFIVEENRQLRMYWKMSTDLSRPLIKSMGAHDPLEGLLCAAQLQKTNDPGIPSIYQKFKKLCTGQDWTIADSLGTGGLLIAATKAAALENPNDLPESSQPKKLLEMALTSLYFYRKTYRKNLPANQRLAFRECGLSLGIRSLKALNPWISTKATTEDLEDFQKLAGEIEEFWISSKVQQTSTWKLHLDINSVSLAASLIAKSQPSFFPV